MTFEEWFEKERFTVEPRIFDFMKLAWDAAKGNK